MKSTTNSGSADDWPRNFVHFGPHTAEKMRLQIRRLKNGPEKVVE